MLLHLRIPKTLLWVFNLLVIFILMFTMYRLITFLVFRPAGEELTEVFPAFFLGLRFDLRWISVLLAPIVIASLRAEFSPFYSQRNKKVWTWYLAIVTFVVFFFFAADFSCFAYNKTRLNASALNFVEDPGISAMMLWQSYPVLWIILGLVAAVLMLRRMFRKMHGHVVIRTDGRGIRYNRKWFLGAALLFGFWIHGSTGVQPLKWKAAFSYDNSFQSYLALNPLQNFFTTLKFRRPQLNESAARQNYPVMSEWMGLQGSSFSFRREVPAIPDAGTPNVVLVLCESFSMYKSSMSGNPLNTTPYFDALAKEGVFFDRCFTPHFSTARGLFATLTGIPDVQLSKFSTRNPQAIDQHTIINDFKDYRKFYFLGGSPSFNNFEGLVKNIGGVDMITEGKFSCKPKDVWGISDQDLFNEANKVLRKQQDPFFAIIQTADNHRPFTIPQNAAGFEKKKLTSEELKRYGFESNEEYNAFRYFDYCIAGFMEAARKEPYFDNTLFVFIGDHGVSGDATAVYPQVWTSNRLTEEHVPLLFYYPSKLPPARHSEVVSQIDVLPTVAGIAGRAYTNTTLGRDLLKKDGGRNYAFTILHDEGQIGMITDSFYFTSNLNFKKEELHFFDPLANYPPHVKDSLIRRMSSVTTAFYETAKWMLVHNKKQ
ncbi:MAG TPA: sulfatase-like hydrolase/transferase [Flavisolibacter sp.]